MAGYTHSSKVKGRLGAIDYENLGELTEAARLHPLLFLLRPQLVL